MTNHLELISTNQSSAARQERRQLLRGFWSAVIVLFLVELYTLKVSSLTIVLSAVLIAFAALFPLYLWCSGKALGMPIFPVFALTYLWTHAIPLLSNARRITLYHPNAILFSSVTVAGFLGLGTFVWFMFVNSPPAPSKSYRLITSQNSDVFFLGILASAVFFIMSSAGGWFTLDSGSFALIRGTVLGISALSAFVLFYRYGTKELSAVNSKILLSLLVLYVLTNVTSLRLIGALSIVLLSSIAFIVGRRKVPWLPIALALICLSFLHYGKGEMRAKYWQAEQAHFVQPWEYPAWYTEWAAYSFNHLNAPASQKVEQQSFVERASIIQLLLLAQARTPKDVPYLSGVTYAIIPQLLVPRILNTNKISSHEGTYLLNIHYGLQNRAATFTTTIGWGLLNEAYANFGLLGCGGLAIILGTAYGQATRWSINTPLLSSRSLFSVLLMSLAFQSEWTAGVYVAAFFQSLVPLGVITFVFMEVHSNAQVFFISNR